MRKTYICHGVPSLSLGNLDIITEILENAHSGLRTLTDQEPIIQDVCGGPALQLIARVMALGKSWGTFVTVEKVGYSPWKKSKSHIMD
jgi:hypothetical protein